MVMRAWQILASLPSLANSFSSSRSHLARVPIIAAVGMLVLAFAGQASAQSAQLSGFVRDPAGGPVAAATVTLANRADARTSTIRTSDRGLFVFAFVRPGTYDLVVTAQGFALLRRSSVVLEASQNSELDLELTIASVTEEVTVDSQATILGTRDGSIGTIVDQKLVANLPLSGRTFHSLVALAPGVANVPNISGAFAVNGQRTDANVLQIDGVSAPSAVGVSVMRDFASGQVPAATTTGGFNALVSVDAIQEFRIQTSTFAPEFGRSPGAQISIATRSGTNALRGSVSTQVRDDSMDARNWFVNYQGLSKPELRQRTFAATLGGPIAAERAFYFGAYEGIHLTEPKIISTAVPSLAARAQASPAARALLNAYPEPTGSDTANMLAEFAISTADRRRAHAASVRTDFNLGNGRQLFARYSDSPSFSDGDFVTNQQRLRFRVQNGTAGWTHALGSRMVADARINISRSTADNVVDSLAADPQVVALSALQPDRVSVSITGTGFGISQGNVTANRQTQMNAVAALSAVFGTHQIKIGGDYRMVRPHLDFGDHAVTVSFANVAAVLAGTASIVQADRYFPVTARYTNASLFAQDTWHASQRLTLTYGLRWDVTPAPLFASGEGPLPALNASTPAQFALATERGGALWRTDYGNIAPRVGVAYAMGRRQEWTLTGGLGMFYDANAQAGGNAFNSLAFPNRTSDLKRNLPIPLRDNDLVGIQEPSLTPPFRGTVGIVDPDLSSAKVLQGNVRLERNIEQLGTLAVAFVGARGRGLVTTTRYLAPNPSFPDLVEATSSHGRSRYSALQVEYRRRAAQGLHVLSSYTLSKAEDTGSVSFGGSAALSEGALSEWGAADFDIRHNLTVAVSYDLPSGGGYLRPLLENWGLDVLGRARSAPPLTVLTGRDVAGFFGAVQERPDLVANQPIYIDDPTAPLGRRLNRAAFVAPQVGTQGTLQRNSIRAFSAAQLDMALRRTFALHGPVRLSLRADVYNVLNTPSFNKPVSSLASPFFGLTRSTLNNLTDSLGPGHQLGSIYQWGGPRSVELTARVTF